MTDRDKPIKEQKDDSRQGDADRKAIDRTSMRRRADER
jgi:hypothetical protein